MSIINKDVFLFLDKRLHYSGRNIASLGYNCTLRFKIETATDSWKPTVTRKLIQFSQMGKFNYFYVFPDGGDIDRKR